MVGNTHRALIHGKASEFPPTPAVVHVLHLQPDVGGKSTWGHAGEPEANAGTPRGTQPEPGEAVPQDPRTGSRCIPSKLLATAGHRRLLQQMSCLLLLLALRRDVVKRVRPE